MVRSFLIGSFKHSLVGWPDNAVEPTTEVAVFNSLANLSGYPHGQGPQLEEMVSATPERIREVLDKLKNSA
jgi:hypothetical protein